LKADVAQIHQHVWLEFVLSTGLELFLFLIFVEKQQVGGLPNKFFDFCVHLP
jgi:hypothetical protein